MISTKEGYNRIDPTFFQLLDMIHRLPAILFRIVFFFCV